MRRSSCHGIALAGFGLAGVLLCGLPGTPAAAATVTTTFGVSADVPATCIVSATDIAFGSYVPTALKDATSTLSITCTTGTTYQVGLDAGLGTGGSTTTRQMSDGAAHLLAYKLFSDSSHTVNWGNNPGVDTVDTGVGTGSVVTSTIYGRIAAGQYMNPATYTDTITVTVTY